MSNSSQIGLDRPVFDEVGLSCDVRSEWARGRIIKPSKKESRLAVLFVVLVEVGPVGRDSVAAR